MLINTASSAAPQVPLCRRMPSLKSSTVAVLTLTVRRSVNTARSRPLLKMLGWSREHWSCVRVNYKHSSVLAATVLQKFFWFDCVEKEYFILTRCSSLSLQLYFDCMYKKIKLFFMRLRLRREILVSCWPLFLSKVNPKTHIKRQATQHDCLPRLFSEGDKQSDIVWGEEKIFYTGLTGTAKEGCKSFVPLRGAQRTNKGRTLFICTPWVPSCLSFNSQQGPALSGLSGWTDQTCVHFWKC
jgi:hypothetical protein